MKAKYNIVMRVTIEHEIDEISPALKSAEEMANDLAQMICDETAHCGSGETFTKSNHIEGKENVKNEI